MRLRAGSTTRLLIVDDDEDFRQAMKALLERDGYEVELARSGKQALELARARSFDLIITDIFMPEMEGLETITHLRREFPSTKIIAMSSGGTLARPDIYLSTARFAGAEASLRKPFRGDALLEVVRKLGGA